VPSTCIFTLSLPIPVEIVIVPLLSAIVTLLPPAIVKESPALNVLLLLVSLIFVVTTAALTPLVELVLMSTSALLIISLGAILNVLLKDLAVTV